jgi:FMN-dependent oxidoreductase (nitrilotriacetate monooxygenase family)
MSGSKRQIQFGVFFHGSDFGPTWNLPESGSWEEFDAYRRVIQTAERGKFAAFFFGEEPRPKVRNGELFENNAAGRGDVITQLSSLAAVSQKIGLVATQTTGHNDPADVAHRLATLNILSGGRAAWNVTTSSSPWIGSAFRRGFHVPHDDRYGNADEFVDAVRAIWAARRSSDISTTRSAEAWARTSTPVTHRGPRLDLTVERTLPVDPDTSPVIVQAGDSSTGRDFAVKQADVVFSTNGNFDDAVAYAADIRRRSAAIGRAEPPKIFPATYIFLGDTEQEARDRYQYIRDHQITPIYALRYLESLWKVDLREQDPDGSLTELLARLGDLGSDASGNLVTGADLIARHRELSSFAAENPDFTIQGFVQRFSEFRGSLIGTPQSVADVIERYAAAGLVDGFNIQPYVTAQTQADVVNTLVPVLQERGIYPEDYVGSTLRENLGLVSA